MERIPKPCLMLITDRTLLTPNWTLAQAVAPAVTGGANVVLFRETDLPPNPRLTVARFVLDGIRGRVPMITAGDHQFALLARAEGVFVEDASEAAAAREAIGPERILGVALTSLDSIAAAELARADFGLLNLDWTNPESAVDLVRRYREAAVIPLVAGVDPPIESIEAVLAVGVDGLAVCAPGMSAYNRTEALQQYSAALHASRNPA